MLEYLILGILQGVTEWLPISSQGQTYIVSQFFGIPATELAGLVLWLHMGTMLAAILYFRHDILMLSRFKEKWLWKYLIIATLFTAVLGVPLYYLTKDAFTTLPGVLLIGVIGALLIVTGLIQKKAAEKDKRVQGTKKDAVIAGLAQGLAILPGVSRSGTTTSTLLFRGIQSEAALRLSFLMSIPAVAAADLGFHLTEGFAVSSGSIIALLASFITGYLTIDVLMRVAHRIRFWKFCIFLGVLSLVPTVFYLVG